MKITKTFAGRLNLDDDLHRLPPEDYVDGLNVTRDAQGAGQDEVISNIVGNRLIAAGYVLPAGVNKTIGLRSDRTRNRVYVFNWNSLSRHHIYYVDKTSRQKVKLLENLTDSAGVDVLSFDPSHRINHIDILYRDPALGDLIFFTDALSRPTKFNERTARTGGYGVVLRSYLNVAKEAPPAPPKAVYENDATVTVNNCRKKLFRFRQRLVFDDKEKSVYSASSEVPLPLNYLDSNTDKDPTQNCRIAVVLTTGAQNVKKIELSVSILSGAGVFSDYVLVDTLDKSQLGLADNDLTIYRFYNDKAYTPLDVQGVIQPFDVVPDQANTQALLNGNVLLYAGITEGYDLSPFAAAATISHVAQQAVPPAMLLWAWQGVMGAFEQGPIHIVCLGAGILTGDSFTVVTTTHTLSYTAAPADTPAIVLNNLATQAQAQGFQVTLHDANNLVITQSAQALLKVFTTPVARPIQDNFGFDYASRYAFAIEYFDAFGKTASARTTSGLSIQTSPYQEVSTVAQMPTTTLSISSRPPVEARYFHILMTRNLSKQNFLYWITDRTFKDDQFAYLSIENLNTFRTDNPSSPLGYSYQPSDRVTFLKNLDQNVVLNLDYELVGTVTNPTLEGVVQQGTFFKIALPTLTSSFSFGAATFIHYLIQLYTPAQPSANGLDVYYEIGERYAISAPGTAQATHQGMTQNQSVDLTVPATFTFIKGDAYYRARKINVGAVYTFNIQGGNQAAADHMMGAHFVSRTYADPNVTTGNSTLENLSTWTGFQTDTSQSILTITTGTYTFRAKGTIIVNIIQRTDLNSWFFRDNLGNTYYAARAVLLDTGIHTIDFDVSFPLRTGQRVFFLFHSESGSRNSKTYSQTVMTLTTQQFFTIAVPDPNFSDYFSSAVNSLGRPWVVDPNSVKAFYPSLYRFSLAYQSDTQINEINRFFSDNQGTWDRGAGEVKKLHVEGRLLHVLHQYDTGLVPILATIIRDQQGAQQLIASDKLVGDITYPYDQHFGIGDFPESFAFAKEAKYFVDPNRKTPVRLSQDGMIPLSVLYKTNAFFVQKLDRFKKANFNGVAAAGSTYAGDPTIYGCFDHYTNKYIIALEEINLYADPSTLSYHQDAVTIPFLETRNESEGFEPPYAYAPEGMAELDNLLFSFKKGEAWTHDSAVYCSFYGTASEAYITVAFNDAMDFKKAWQALRQSGSVLWDSPVIESQTMSYGTTPQRSNLVDGDYTLKGGMWEAALLRDQNSIGGIANGDRLKGSYLVVRFRVNTDKAAQLCTLSIVESIILDAPVNKK